MNGDTPFRDTPFCFHLAGSTNNLFPSRRAGLDSLKVGFSMFSRKGLCELQADRICTQKAAPRPHKHRRKMSQNPEDSSAAKSQHPHRVEDLHCRDSRVTGQQEGHPPGTPHPWLGASWEMLPSGPYARGADFTGLGCSQAFGVFKITPQLTLMCRWVSKPLPWSPVIKAAWATKFYSL